MGGTPNVNKRKSRKRAFGHAFGHSIDEGRECGIEALDTKEDEEDEDDDLQREQKDTITSLLKPIRPKKRAKVQQKKHVDTPDVGAKLYFDPIHLHNGHCPFVRQHLYGKESVAGYVYALRLLPKDVMYIKQIVENHKKEGNH